MKLSFHGANRGVTGSCHLIECAGRRILIDCGLYQGGRELEEENAEPFGFDAASIDFVLLTHAHLDHCGRLPLLVKRGFKGEIITTSASRELARVVMLDAAHLHEEDAFYRNKKIKNEKDKVEPLYTTPDALTAMEYFGRSASYHECLDVAPGVKATFIDAGHILGSASILVELQEAQKKCRVLFSGDIGNRGRPLLRVPQTEEADVVVMETTYGDKMHKPIGASVDELYKAVRETFARGGNVIIPTFALERAQELLYFLGEGIKKGLLPQSPKVYLDSPMAISATGIFEHHPECFNDETQKLFEGGRDPFLLPDLQFTRDGADSIAINELKSGCIIMAGSGMCTGGRIRHHIRNNIGRKEASIVFVGFAAKGTLARTIIDGAKSVRLFGDEIPVRAQIHTIGGFSAHADQAELLEWHSRTKAKRTILVHGDDDVMARFAKMLGPTKVDMPRLSDVYQL